MVGLEHYAAFALLVVVTISTAARVDALVWSQYVSNTVREGNETVLEYTAGFTDQISYYERLRLLDCGAATMQAVTVAHDLKGADDSGPDFRLLADAEFPMLARLREIRRERPQPLNDLTDFSGFLGERSSSTGWVEECPFDSVGPRICRRVLPIDPRWTR